MVTDYRLAALGVLILVVALLSVACAVSRTTREAVGRATPEAGLATRVAAAQARADATRDAAATSAAATDATAAAAPRPATATVASTAAAVATVMPTTIATARPVAATVPPSAPTSAAAPVATATSVNTLSASDFSSWPAGEAGPPVSARGRFDPATKSYTLALTDPQRGYVYSLNAPNAPQLKDFQLDVDAHRVAGPERGSYGVTFRVQPQGPNDKTAASYNLLVHPDTGTIGLTWTDANDVGKTVVPRTAHPAIKKGTETNHLTVIARGDMVTIVVNEQTIGTFRVEQVAPGAVGLIIINPANGGTPTGMTAAFSNFRLSGPPPDMPVSSPSATVIAR